MASSEATAAAAEGACEPCGWAAAFCAMLAFGSFGVPIKDRAAMAVDVDPLVFQSYKTFCCFATSWLVLLFGTPFAFTPWGILSGLFWVPSGTATVYAVKHAGLAIGIGVGSSCIVLVSFFWGIFIFEEHVHSRAGASFAIVCMIAGLVGMSYYSSPESAGDDGNGDTREEGSEPSRDAARENSGVFAVGSEEDEGAGLHRVTHNAMPDYSQRAVLYGAILTERRRGILAAAFCGTYGGSIMVPMKYAPPDAKGVGFLPSFAIGAALVTVGLWLLRFLRRWHQCASAATAWRSLPPFHLVALWLPGGIAGMLWSVGNFFSLLSVYFLGEGVGYPLVQTSILVSGLWGIFYFKEVTGVARVSKWLASSLLTISGILLLSYEHHAS